MISDNTGHSPKLTVSVVIPTCDRPEAFVREAILSACNQSLSPYEIIIVDNGAVPFRVSCHETFIQYIKTTIHCGASYARNIGARAAKSEFLAFLDDDDWWHPEFLATALAKISAEHLDAVYGMIVDSYNGRQLGSRVLSNPPALGKEVLLTNSGCGGINLVVRRSVFHAVGGFRVDLKTSEDRALAADLLIQHFKVGSTPEAIAYARHHAGPRLRLSVRSRLRFYCIFFKYYTYSDSIVYFGRLALVILKRISQSARVGCSHVKQKILAKLVH